MLRIFAKNKNTMFFNNKNNNKKDRTKPEPQEREPEYWEKASYIHAIPRSGYVLLDEDMLDRVEAIDGIELLDSHLPDEDGPGAIKVKYLGEVYKVGFYKSDFTLPDMLSRQGYYFTDEEMADIANATSSLTIFMDFKGDAATCYHLQIKLAVAMVPDLLAIMDESAERLVNGRWATLAAESSVVPGATSLFTVQAVSDEGGEVWLHTHGLNRCGVYELEILQSDRDPCNEHSNIIQTLASSMLTAKDGAPKPTAGIHIGMLSDNEPIVATYLPWTKAINAYTNLALGGMADRADGHNGRTAPVFLYSSEDDIKNGTMHKVDKINDRIGDNPLFFITSEETSRMSALARERFGLVKYMSTKDCTILIKVGLLTDSCQSGDEREHIWFKLLEMDDNGFSAELIQEPYDVKAMHEGDRGHYTIDDVTEWRIYLDEGCVTPDTTYLLV